MIFELDRIIYSIIISLYLLGFQIPVIAMEAKTDLELNAIDCVKAECLEAGMIAGEKLETTIWRKSQYRMICVRRPARYIILLLMRRVFVVVPEIIAR